MVKKYQFKDLLSNAISMLDSLKKLCKKSLKVTFFYFRPNFFLGARTKKKSKKEDSLIFKEKD